MTKKAIIALILILSGLSGCKVGPNYTPPQNAIPEGWSALSNLPAKPEIPFTYEEPPTLWWQIFDDPFLNAYILSAAKFNNNVLKAETNILQAKATRAVSAAPLFPKITGDFDAFHTFLSRNGPIDALAGAGAAQGAAAGAAASQAPQKFNLFNNFIDASWELDLFGKTRRSVEAAQAGLESSIEQRNDILVSLFGEIAMNYVQLRSAQKQKRLLERNIELLEKNVQIIQRRYLTGYSNLLDLEQIDIQLNQAIAALPAATIAIYRSIYAISVLTGELPEKLVEELLPGYPLPDLPESLPIGLRSDLLRRRPDIREAERNLAQATANIGVAVASFYPSVSLTGILGVQSLKICNLFSPGSKTWIYGADIKMPIFEGGKLVGNLKIAEAQTAALAFTYQQTVLNALRDVETAIISYEEDARTAQELKKVVDSNEKLSRLNKLRYTKGLVSQIDDLNSELILNNSELSLLQSETSALLDLVTLYKGIGGGWEPFDVCVEAVLKFEL